jgi:hypothetical protein
MSPVGNFQCDKVQQEEIDTVRISPAGNFQYDKVQPEGVDSKTKSGQ